MVDVTQYVYKSKELTALIIKDREIHDGLWQLLVNFGMGATNIGPSEAEVAPAAIVTVQSIGIQRVPQTGPLAVDAAEVNPPSGK